MFYLRGRRGAKSPIPGSSPVDDVDHKILIVERESPSASRVVRALRTAGFRVVAPASPATTLATFDRVRPDLVVIGSSLPDDGGVALCHEIKQTQHGSRTPVALMVDNMEIDSASHRRARLGPADRKRDRRRRARLHLSRADPVARPIGCRGGERAGCLAFGEPTNIDTGDRALDDAIDQALTFEHEESVAHVRRTTAPVPVEPAQTAPAPAREAQPERPRYQTAALVGTKPQPAEPAKPEPEPEATVPAAAGRRWWVGAAIGVGAVALIAVGAWLAFSGGETPIPPATFPASSNASFAPPVPFSAAPDVEEEAAPEEETPVVASVEPPKQAEPEPAPAKPKPKPEPEPEPEPVVAEAVPEPEPEPEPVVVEMPPPPEPEPEPEPEPVVEQTPEPEPEPVAVETPPAPEPEPEPEKPAPLVEPVLLERVEPAPSPKEIKRNRGATVVLRLLVNEQGNVIRVVVDQGIPGSELEAAAVNAVLRWKYRPASRGGVPEQAWTEARFTFN